MEPAKSGGESKTLNFLYFQWKSIKNQWFSKILLLCLGGWPRFIGHWLVLGWRCLKCSSGCGKLRSVRNSKRYSISDFEIIHPTQNDFFHFWRPGNRFSGGQALGRLEGFDGFCEFLQFLSRDLENWELGASPDGILGSFIKQNEEFRSRPSLGESPKPWIFFIFIDFIENPLKINNPNDFIPILGGWYRFIGHWLVVGWRCLKSSFGCGKLRSVKNSKSYSISDFEFIHPT